MRNERPVSLLRIADQQVIQAKLITGLTTDEVDEAEGLWSPFLNQQLASGVDRPEHSHWNWSLLARAVAGTPNYAICGVTVDDEIQGLMLREDTFAKAKHQSQAGTSMVYVDFIATAPWNNPDVVGSPLYRGAGLVLIEEATTHSDLLGYKARLGLHSLKGSENFYRDRCRMIDLGIDDNDRRHQGLRYFEFTKAEGQAFLRSRSSK